MFSGFPYARPGQAIGLFGGSFDPAHAAHAYLTRCALSRFGLAQVWCLVSPGNPLKTQGPAPLAQRMCRAQVELDHPRVVVSDLEARLGTRYTAETIHALKARYPGVRFVWIMGADNLAQLPLWRNWQGIMAEVPLGVLARPGFSLSARLSRPARLYARHRVTARCLAAAKAPAWCFANIPMTTLSSSSIRARGDWSRAAHSDGRSQSSEIAAQAPPPLGADVDEG